MVKDNFTKSHLPSDVRTEFDLKDSFATLKYLRDNLVNFGQNKND